MSEKIYWIAVDMEHVPGAEQMKSIAEAINEGLDHEVIVTTKEIEPVDKAEIKRMLENDGVVEQ